MLDYSWQMFKGQELPTHKTQTIAHSPQAYHEGQGWVRTSKHEPYFPSLPFFQLINQLLMKWQGGKGGTVMHK